MTVSEMQKAFREHIKVCVSGEDSYFEGTIQGYFPKRSGLIRCAVENDNGILHIFAPKQLEWTE